MSFVCCRFLGRQRSAVWGSPVTPTLREKNEFEAEVQSQGLTWIMLRERGEKRTCTRKDRSLVRVGLSHHILKLYRKRHRHHTIGV